MTEQLTTEQLILTTNIQKIRQFNIIGKICLLNKNIIIRVRLGKIYSSACILHQVACILRQVACILRQVVCILRQVARNLAKKIFVVQSHSIRCSVISHSVAQSFGRQSFSHQLFSRQSLVVQSFDVQSQNQKIHIKGGHLILFSRIHTAKSLLFHHGLLSLNCQFFFYVQVC